MQLPITRPWAELTPVEHVVLLYDRMAADLQSARRGLLASDRSAAQRAIRSLRAILATLSGALNYQADPALARLLDQVYQAIEAQIEGFTLDGVLRAQQLLTPMHEAWLGVARQTLGREPARLGAV